MISYDLYSKNDGVLATYLSFILQTELKYHQVQKIN